MKYILILFAFLICGCQQSSIVQKQIDLQENLIDTKYDMIRSDLHVKYMVNPVKYTALYDYIRALDASFGALQKELLITDGYGDESNNIVFAYYKMVESSFTRGYLDDEFKKCRSCINDILNGKTRSLLERKMSILYLKSFHTALVENQIDEMGYGDFKFNIIQPIIMADRHVVSPGETYEARIMLVAMDSTRHPIYNIDKGFVGYGPRGEGIVRFKAKEKGEHAWGGSVKWVTESGVELELNFEQTYKVE